MKKGKYMWTLKQLQDKDAPKTNINGKWVPARPINYTCRTLKERIVEAWMVFIRKAEPFIWPEGQ